MPLPKISISSGGAWAASSAISGAVRVKVGHPWSKTSDGAKAVSA